MAWVTPTNVATGDVLTASTWNQAVVENTSVLYASQRRLALQTRAGTAASGGTVGAAAEIFSSDLTFTSAGSTTYVVEVFLPYIETATNAGAYLEVHVTNGAGSTVMQTGYHGKGNGTQSAIGTHRSTFFYTPAAGTITLNVVTVHITAAGTAGSVTGAPAFLAVYGPNMT